MMRLTTSRLNIIASQFWRQRLRAATAVLEATLAPFTGERQRADFDDLDDVQQHRHRQCPERNAEPVGRRNRQRDIQCLERRNRRSLIAPFTLNGASSTGTAVQVQLSSASTAVASASNFASGFTFNPAAFSTVQRDLDGQPGCRRCLAGRRVARGRRSRREGRHLARRALRSTVVGRCNWAAPARRRGQTSRLA